jgi:large subunit ribosomal protein L35Ae
MKAKIVAFKGSRRSCNSKYCILDVEEKSNLIGKKLVWKTPTGRKISGKILRTHGKNTLLARFVKGLPGYAVGDEVEIGTIE